MDLSSFVIALQNDFMGQQAWIWILFLTVIGTLLFVDLFILNKKDHVVGLQESLRLTGLYLSLGALFGLWVWYNGGTDQAADYYTVWLLEQSLSLDNLFVMSVIFASFQIPREYQHRVLFWGILGVIVFRGIMIGAGAALVSEYKEVLLLFALILIATGIKMMFIKTDEQEDYSQKPYVRWLAKHLRVDPHIHGNKFFVRLSDHHNPDPPRSVLYATPLFLCLCTIEVTDIMFAFDSVPAALAITQDAYIVYTANIFAILGLRAMFFAMEHVLHRFEYLKYSLSIILVFIGLKVFYNEFFGHIPAMASLCITLGVLVAGVVVSMVRTRGEPDTEHMTDSVEHKK